MTRKVPFGKSMREAHFQFAPSYTPINHGSFGAYPRFVQERQDEFQKLVHHRPDTFIVFDLPKLIDESRAAVAPMLGVPVDEVVFVPNATTGVNTVLRNLKFEEGDVVVHFSTIYGACKKTLASIGEMTPLISVCIELEYPMEDGAVVRRFRDMVSKVRSQGRKVRLAMFDTVLTFPGVRMPWEDLVVACKELDVLSLVDGAHGIGHIDLTHLGIVGPDFFVSNCYKWLYTPRGCAVFHVPARNQHLIRTSLPTSHGYRHLSECPNQDGKTPFVHLFEFVATIDYTPYVCIPASLEFRKNICGSETEIRSYCWEIARIGGKRVADILGTNVMDNKARTLTKCCFANVRLPLTFRKDGTPLQDKEFDFSDASKIQVWLNSTAVREFDMYLQLALHSGSMWIRLSGQIYLELGDFEWVGFKLKELCKRLENGEMNFKK